MLFIFRKLRRSFFLPGKVRTYCAYAAGEIVLIVVGILLALQISEWNQGRKDRVEEAEILVRLKADFEENQETLTRRQLSWQNSSEQVRGLLEKMGPEPEHYPDELINQQMTELYRISNYVPNRGAIDALLSSGKITLIQNEELRYKLNVWPTKIEEYQSSYGVISQTVYDFQIRFLEHFRIRDSQIVKNPQKGHTGPSKFQNDQKALLSMPELESAAELKRIDVDGIEVLIVNILDLQQSILTLIDAEVAERGITDSL